MWGDIKAGFILLLFAGTVVGGLFLLNDDWGEWYLGWLLYPLYFLVPAGILWLIFMFLGIVQDFFEGNYKKNSNSAEIPPQSKQESKSIEPDTDPEIEQQEKTGNAVIERIRQWIGERIEEA